MTLNDAQGQDAAPAAPATEPQVDNPAASSPQDSTAAPVPPPQPEQFQFMGRVFPSKEAAEQAMAHTLRSAKGRIEAAQRQRELTQPPPPAAPAAPKAPYDLAVYNELRATYGVEHAENYRREETEKANREALKKEIETQLEPLKQFHAQQEQTQRTIVLFQDAKGKVDSQGNLLYPELSHPQAHRAVLEEWQTLHPETAFTPEGIAQAVFLFRGKAASGARRQPQPPSRQAPTGQSASPASGGAPMPGGASPASARPQAPGIPRYKSVDPLTGEVY